MLWPFKNLIAVLFCMSYVMSKFVLFADDLKLYFAVPFNKVAGLGASAVLHLCVIPKKPVLRPLLFREGMCPYLVLKA